MTQLTLKQVETIKQAKSGIQDVAFDMDVLDNPESGLKYIRNIMGMKMPILWKQSIITVLLSGTFTYDGFMMPSTAACCENFATVKKQLSKKRGLSIFIHDPLDARADVDGYFSVNVF